MNNPFFKLMLVTNKKNIALETYLDFIKQCAEAGITSVQLREKSLSFDELLILGKHIQTILKPFSIPLIINDHLELAYQLNAEGVHLGQKDGCVFAAREKLGNDKIIGLSVDTIEQLYDANKYPINYVGIGAIFPTQNKPDVSTFWGCQGLKQIVSLTKHPIVAIGGIDESNVSLVMKAGAHGIAAIGAFHDSRDPTTSTRNLLSLMREEHHVRTH